LNPEHEPPRVLGGLDAFSVVVGGAVGVGIFFTPSRVAQIVGTSGLALAAWTLAGAIALCGALSFAELGGLYHGSGAQYTILRDAYGPLLVYVICNATAVQGGAIAIIGIVCSMNLGIATTGQAPTGVALFGLATAIIVGLTAANIVGVRVGSRIQNMTTAAKITTLVAVALLAATVPAHGETEAPRAGAIGAVGSVLAALVPAFFTYSGWQQALWVAGEVRDPRLTLPRAIVSGVLTVIVIYLFANWAYLHLLGARGVGASEALAADAVAAVWPTTGRRAVAAAVAVSSFGVLNAQLLAGPRLIHGMARDRYPHRVDRAPRWDGARPPTDGRYARCDWPLAQWRRLHRRDLLRARRRSVVRGAKKAARRRPPRAGAGLSLRPAGVRDRRSGSRRRLVRRSRSEERHADWSALACGCDGALSGQVP